MNIIQLKDVNTQKTFPSDGIFISKYGMNYLIGPKITNNLNITNLKKRMASSSVREIGKYKTVKLRKANSLISNYIDNIDENEIIEVLKGKIVAKHKVLDIPGEEQ